jgi:hypothetical protein
MIGDMRLRLARTLGGLLLLTLIAASSAVAAPAWLAPIGLSAEAQIAREPRVAVDAQGDALAVWERGEGEGSSVQATFRPAGGAWQAPVSLSSSSESQWEPQVAFDGQGDAFAVWEAYNGAHSNVQTAFKPAGGAWQAPVELSSDEAPGAVHPQLAVDAQGDAIVIWDRALPYGGVVQTAYRPAGGSWQTPVSISELGVDPQIALNAQGDAVAVWAHDNGSNYVIQSALKPAGGTWQAPVDLSEAGETAERPQIALDGQGDAIAVWHRWTDGLFSNRIVQAAFMPAGSGWQAPVDISGEGGGVEPQVAFDGQGDAIAVWSGNGVAYRPAGGSWEAPTELEPGGEAQRPQIAFDGQGNVLAVWARNNGIRAATRLPDGVWDGPVSLSSEEGAYAPQVAVDGQGNAAAVWDRENPTATIQGAGYVAAGPRLNSVSIPTTGTVGNPIAFSASPLDVWSVPGETSWSFGDNTSASGTSVTHTYSSAGSFEVTLHSADLLGNVTSISGEITIAPAPQTSTPPAVPAPVQTTEPPPQIGTVSQSASIWRESGKQPLGTTFSVSLNERATISLSFTLHANGRSAKGKCGARIEKNRLKRLCGRAATRGTLTFIGHPGKNNISFSGHVPRSARLIPGHYTLLVTATNAAGQNSSQRRLAFMIMG